MPRRLNKSHNRLFIEILSERPIAFLPLLAKVAGSASSGLFMSQLLYWWGKGIKEGEIYKTIDEMEEETYLSRSEQDVAIRKWKELGVLEVRKAGIPPKRHFRINTEYLLQIASEAKGPSYLQKPANQFARNSDTNCRGRQNNTESIKEILQRSDVYKKINRSR